MPAIKQLAYQRRQLDAGLCRRGCRRPRQIDKNGKASVFCEFCRASDNAARAAYRRQNRLPAPQPPPPPPPPPPIPIDDALTPKELAALMRYTCAECGNVLTGYRVRNRIPYCPDCKPNLC